MLRDLTADPVMRLLIDRTRRASTAGPDLADAHRRVGSALAAAAAARCALVSTPIEHPTGPSTGVRLADAAPIVVAMMRGGLFLAEGLWTCLPGAALVCARGAADLVDVPLEGRPVILVDSVINSGRSVDAFLTTMSERGAAWLTVATLVAHAGGIARCVATWPDVDFVVGRVSERSYVGHGTTDTGDRLFGTTTWR